MNKINRWIALDCCEIRRLSLNAFFGNTYGTETSLATNFAVNIRSTVTCWISIARAQSWPSNWTVADITIVQAKFAIRRGRNSWLATESLYCDSGIVRFGKSSIACCEQSGSRSRSDSKTIPHLHPLPLRKGEAKSNARSAETCATGASPWCLISRATMIYFPNET